MRCGRFSREYQNAKFYQVLQQGEKVAIVAAGSFVPLGYHLVEKLKEHQLNATLINPRFLSGLDDKLLEDLKKNHQLVVTMEDGELDGGFGEKIARFYGPSDMKVLNYGLRKEFVDQYDAGELLSANRLTAPQIVEDIATVL